MAITAATYEEARDAMIAASALDRALDPIIVVRRINGDTHRCYMADEHPRGYPLGRGYEIAARWSHGEWVRLAETPARGRWTLTAKVTTRTRKGWRDEETGQYAGETAMEYLRRVVGCVAHEPESLLDQLPTPAAIIDFFVLWDTYDTEYLAGVIECIEAGADPAPYEEFVARHGLPRAWFPVVGKVEPERTRCMYAYCDEPDIYEVERGYRLCAEHAAEYGTERNWAGEG